MQAGTQLSCAALMLLLTLGCQQAACLPPPSDTPSKTTPFVFFHLRKTGGTSLRHEIHVSAINRQLKAYVPCYDADCGRIEPRNWQQQVLAGHFSWSYVHSERPAWMHNPTISCLTVFRQPLERVRSCYYYSMNLAPLKWTDLTPTQMQQLLTHTNMGELCMNEPVRIFSGLGDDHLIANLYRYPTLSEQAVKLSKERLSQCIVLMQEDLNAPITRAILKHWFPWIILTGYEVNVTPDKPSREKLNPEQEAKLRELLGTEFELYNAAMKQYHDQIDYLWQTARPLVKSVNMTNVQGLMQRGQGAVTQTLPARPALVPKASSTSRT